MSTSHGDFSHHYETLVPHDQFQHVQKILTGYHKKPFQALSRPFVLRGLVTCAQCGCIVSPEIKKGKYVYYIAAPMLREIAPDIT